MTKISSTLPFKVLKLVNSSPRPIATTERAEKFFVSWDRTVTALRDLRGDGEIEGHKFGAGGQGIWVWWRKDAFRKVEG